MKTDKLQIDKRSEGGVKEILIVAFPLIISSATHTVLTFTDRMFLSWYSPDCIAASGPASILSYAFICFFIGTGMYISTLVAQYFGAGKSALITKSLWQGIYFGLVSIIIIIALIPVGHIFINSSGHGEQIIVLEKLYFDILMYGGGLSVVGSVFSSFCSGMGNTKIVMYLTFLSTAINIILDYLLIFGKLGIPSLGIVGAGIATFISHVIFVAIFSYIIFKKKNRVKYRVHKLWRFDRKIFLKLISYGTPEGFHFFIDIAGFTVFIFFIGAYGESALAASNIAIFVDMLAFMPMIGIGIATSILAGQYIGKRKKQVAITVTNNSMIITLIYGVFIGGMFWFFPMIFINLFKGADIDAFSQITTHAIPIFHVLPFFLIADSFHIIFGCALAGAGDTKYKMIVAALIVALLFVPGEYLILKVWQLPLTYGWWWCAFYLLIIGMIYLYRFRQEKWKRIDMISH